MVRGSSYVVDFFKKIDDIKGRFLQYIEKIKPDDQSHPIIISEEEHKPCKIVKVHNKSNKIKPAFIYPWKWLNLPKHFKKIFIMLRDVLQIKKMKLEKQGFMEPKIY